MLDELQKNLSVACQKVFGVEAKPELSRTAEQFGDYATNVAMQLAGQLNKNPREIAEELVPELEKIDGVAKAAVAGPGFINLTLTDQKIAEAAASATELPKPNAGKEILVEFGDPNPFKEMHIGHLYSYIVGDAISSLLETTGADVKRLSYHGDVGLHVAKAIWGMQQAKINLDSSVDAVKNNVGIYYAAGAAAYEDSPEAKAAIDQLNEQIYGSDPEIKNLYDWGKQSSFANFDQTLKVLGIKTDKRYLESQTAPAGIKTVEANTGKVFEQSEGAIVYKGEKAGLHTRVFITSKGLPTYETKDLGLVELKNHDYPNAERSIIITANEQAEYFKVMLAALAEISKELAAKTTHLTHGFVNLSTGKMSSRKGNVYSAISLMLDAETEAKKLYPESAESVYLAAVKHAFLKNRLGSDITYDLNETISLEGNSGPYLQYAHARACSILAKAKAEPKSSTELESGERSLARKISEFPEVVQVATVELMPHHICTYLYELAQTFNRFYENNRVIDDPREGLRLQLVEQYANVLKAGLHLLNIEAPERM